MSLTSTGGEPTSGIKILIVNVMNTSKITEYVNWASTNKYDLLAINEYRFSDSDERQPNLIVREDVRTKIAVMVLRQSLQVKCPCTAIDHIVIKVMDPPVLIHFWYLRPDAKNNQGNTDIISNIAEHLRKKARRVIHTGDLNARLVELGDKVSTRRGRLLKDSLDEGDYALINDPGTFTFRQKAAKEGDMGKSIIDWTIVSKDMVDLVTWNAIPCHLGSDHEMISLTIRGRITEVTPTIEQKISPAAFLKKIKKNTSDNNFDRWSEDFEDAVATSKREVAKRKLFEDDGLDHIRSELTNLAKRIRRGEGNESDLRTNIRELTRQLKEKKDEIAKHKRARELESITSQAAYKKLKSTSATTSCKFIVTNEGHHLGIEAAELLANKLFQHEDQDPIHLPTNLEKDDCPFTKEELGSTLATFRKGKAPGKSGVSAELLKQWFTMDGDYLTGLFNHWLNKGIFPGPLKVSVIKPLIKNRATQSTLSNIRPIALTECLAKWYEKVLSCRLKHYLESKKILSGAQYSYREQRSAVDAAAKLMKQRLNNENLRTEVLMQLDVASAFDRVTHAAVAKALVEARLPGNLTRVMIDFLKDRKAMITFGDASVTRDMIRGVPQGSVLGPQLYTLATNSVLLAVNRRMRQMPNTKACLVSYADDIIINLASNESEDVIMKLAEDYLRLIARKLSECGLELSTGKTKLMITGDSPVIRPITMNNCELMTVETIKFLGIYFSYNNLADIHLEKLVNTAKAWLRAQEPILNSHSYLPVSVRQTLMKSVLIPKITYGAEIWWPAVTNYRPLKNLARDVMITTTASPRHAGYVSTSYLSGMLPIDRHCQWLSELARSEDLKKVDKKPTTTQLGHPAERRRLAILGTLNTEEEIHSTVANVKYYTDGSQYTEQNEILTGAAYIRLEEEIIPTAYMIKLDQLNSVFQAEVIAIQQALLDIRKRGQANKSVIIYSDSLSALTSITAPARKTGLANEARNTLDELLLEGYDIRLAHVRAHVGIRGNEIADALAKEAAKNGDMMIAPLSKRVLATLIREGVKEDHINQLLSDNTGVTIKQFFDDPDEVRRKRIKLNQFTAQIYTGQGPNLTSNVYGYKNAASTCICGQTQTTPHLIVSCVSVMENNIKAANQAGISTADFLQGWEVVKKHKNFHDYIALRAKSLLKEVLIMNELPSKMVWVERGLRRTKISDLVEEKRKFLDWIEAGYPAGRTQWPYLKLPIHSDRSFITSESERSTQAERENKRSILVEASSEGARLHPLQLIMEEANAEGWNEETLRYLQRPKPPGETLANQQ